MFNACDLQKHYQQYYFQFRVQHFISKYITKCLKQLHNFLSKCFRITAVCKYITAHTGKNYYVNIEVTYGLKKIRRSGAKFFVCALLTPFLPRMVNLQTNVHLAILLQISWTIILWTWVLLHNYSHMQCSLPYRTIFVTRYKRVQSLFSPELRNDNTKSFIMWNNSFILF